MMIPIRRVLFEVWMWKVVSWMEIVVEGDAHGDSLLVERYVSVSFRFPNDAWCYYFVFRVLVGPYLSTMY